MKGLRLVVPLCVLPLLVAHAVGQAPIRAESTFDDVRDLLRRGAYGEAEREAAKLTARLALERGAATLEVGRAQDLLVEALIRSGKTGASSTFELAEGVVRLKERLAGPSNLETAQSLHNMGTLHHERGEFRLALSLHQRALQIREAQLARGHPAVADSLDGAAFALIRLQRFDEARQALNRSQTIRETRSGDSPLAIAGTLELVGWLNRYSGNYSAAKPSLLRALDIRRRIAPEHPDMVSASELLGDLQFLDGDIAGARSTWTNALTLGERTLGLEHPTLAALLRRLALTARAFGNQTEVRLLLDRGVSIADRRLAPCNPEVAWLLNDLAGSGLVTGEYIEAQALYQRARVTFEKCLGPHDSNVATALHNQADVAAVWMGDFAEAERLHEQAIRIWSATLGPNHPYVARGLDALAAVAAARGQRERARGLYQRALAIRKQAVGSDHPDVAWTLTNLARLDAQSGKLVVALRSVTNAVDIYQRAGAQDDPDHFARVLALRGEIEMRRADYSAAHASFAEALSTRERIFGREHPLAAESRAELAAADFAIGSTDDALSGALDGERTGREHLRFTVRYLPERQAMAYAAKRPRGLDLALSIVAAGQASDATPAFDALIRSRGVILDELAARARAAVSVDSDLAPLNAALVAARQRFATLMLRSLQGEESVSRALLDDARRQKEEAERALAERSATVRAELAQANVGLSDVRAALPTSSALVSFVRYNRTTFSTATTRAPSVPQITPSYLAIVTRSDSPNVDVVPVGSASSLDALVFAWHDEAGGQSLARSSVAESMSAYRVAGTRLRRRVWDPIAEHVRDVSHVFVVPDGALNLLSFAALPTGTHGFLLETGPVIHYAATERDLIHRDDELVVAGGLLAVGGPTFDLSPRRSSTATLTARGALTATRGAQYGCSNVATLQFDPLPETTREVGEIAKLWPSLAGSDVTVLTGVRASETAVKTAAIGRRVVHLATHGFFLDSRCGLGIENTRSVGGLTSRSSTVPTGLLESPLSLAGLALAGANRRGGATRASRDDGILTGEEVAGLNLHGTEWAVLSACDTGLGEIKAGEGVFGLRRAFQIAGARTVIMSLWSVDDQAARLWMRALYEGRLQKHLSTADAMHQASLSVLRARRARGESTHPFYWAGFVAAGDWK